MYLIVLYGIHYYLIRNSIIIQFYRQKRDGVVQWIEHFPIKRETQCSNPVPMLVPTSLVFIV